MIFKLGINVYDFDKIIDKEIAKQFRDEAKAIVHNAMTEFHNCHNWKDKYYWHEWIVELLDYHLEKQGNLFCLQLEHIKKELAKIGKMNIEEGNFNSMAKLDV